MSGLLRIPMKKVGATIPVPTGENLKLVTGQMKTAGEALAGAGGEEDVLVVAGQLLVTTPVERVGYGEMIVAGQVYAPEGSEAALTAGISRLTGQVFYYSGKLRFFVGEERFGRGFFEVLEGPMAMILVGEFTIERGVPADLLKEKVSQILLAGELRAPRELLPLVQVLTVEKAGEISALDEGDEVRRQPPGTRTSDRGWKPNQTPVSATGRTYDSPEQRRSTEPGARVIGPTGDRVSPSVFVPART
jgi:hypothetical protein